MLRITYSLKSNTQILKQILYINKNMVLSQIGENKTLYLKDYNSVFKIVNNRKELVPINYEQIKIQMKQLYSIIGTIQMKQINTNPYFDNLESKEFYFSNSSSSANYSGTIKIVHLSDLNDTSYYSFYNYEKRSQLIELPIESSWLIAYNKTELIINNTHQNQELKLVSIEKDVFDPYFESTKEYKILC